MSVQWVFRSSSKAQGFFLFISLMKRKNLILNLIFYEESFFRVFSLYWNRMGKNFKNFFMRKSLGSYVMDSIFIDAAVVRAKYFGFIFRIFLNFPFGLRVFRGHVDMERIAFQRIVTSSNY